VGVREPNWRWRRARAETTWVEAWRRSLVELVSTGIITVAALLAFSSEGAAIDTLIALGVSFLMVFVVRPAVALGWNYLQAPMRALTDDVQAIRERLEASPSLPRPPTQTDIRLEVLEHARKGQDLLDNYGSAVPTPYADGWSEEASGYLREHAYALDAGLIEDFFAATGQYQQGRLEAKVAALVAVADSLRDSGSASGGAVE
jgi:hypothetical protein